MNAHTYYDLPRDAETITDSFGQEWVNTGKRGMGGFDLWVPVVHPFSGTLRVWDDGQYITEVGGTRFVYLHREDFQEGIVHRTYH